MLNNNMQVQKAGRKRTCQRRGNTARICLQVCTNDFTFLVSPVRLREEERLSVSVQTSRFSALETGRLGGAQDRYFNSRHMRGRVVVVVTALYLYWHMLGHKQQCTRKTGV